MRTKTCRGGKTFRHTVSWLLTSALFLVAVSGAVAQTVNQTADKPFVVGVLLQSQMGVRG